MNKLVVFSETEYDKLPSLLAHDLAEAFAKRGCVLTDGGATVDNPKAYLTGMLIAAFGKMVKTQEIQL